MELQLLPSDRYSVYPIKSDCELREFLKEKQLEFKRGCAFYEFLHEYERISEDQVIILKKEVSDLKTSYKIMHAMLIIIGTPCFFLSH